MQELPMKTLIAVAAISLSLATPSIAAELIDRTVFFTKGNNIENVVPKDECRGNSGCSRWVTKTYERKDGTTFTRTKQRNEPGQNDGGACKNCNGGDRNKSDRSKRK
jgi:hypothetical protein